MIIVSPTYDCQVCQSYTAHMATDTLGKRIAKARREKGLREGRDVGKAELGRAAGISGQAIAEWEADKSTPRTGNLIAAARFLGVSLDWLAHGRGEMRPESILARLVHEEEKATVEAQQVIARGYLTRTRRGG